MDKKSSIRFLGLSALAIGAGLLSLVACSQNTATDSSEAARGKEMAGAQKFLTAAKTQSSDDSSLEAHRRGTLGDDAGPLREVHFDFDRYDLSPSTRDVLNKVHAAWLKAHPEAVVEIEGHADDRGTNEYNLALGAKRAENVKRHLMDLGITADRLSTVSYGEELQLCKQQSETCWAKNRRAHFAVRAVPTN